MMVSAKEKDWGREQEVLEKEGLGRIAIGGFTEKMNI